MNKVIHSISVEGKTLKSYKSICRVGATIYICPVIDWHQISFPDDGWMDGDFKQMNDRWIDLFIFLTVQNSPL